MSSRIYLGIVTLEAAPDLDVELVYGHDIGQLRHLLQCLILHTSIKDARISVVR